MMLISQLVHQHIIDKQRQRVQRSYMDRFILNIQFMNQQEKVERHKNKISRHQQPKNMSNIVKNQLSSEMAALLARIIRDGVRNPQQLPLKQLLDQCEHELVRLSKVKAGDRAIKPGMCDNELTVSVVGMQARIILQERLQNQENSKGSLSPREMSNFERSRQNIIIKRYESLIGEMDKNESEIRKFMDGQVFFHKEVDFSHCLEFFAGVTQILKRNGGQKIIASRIRLIQILTFFLKEAVRRLQPEKHQHSTAQENISDGSIIYNVETTVLTEQDQNQEEEQQQIRGNNPHENLSYQQVNQYSRFASRFLDQKMIQLSGICEQITQLEVFNRTLQFSQLEQSSRKAFLRVVDVIMSLHNRVAYLSRRKPQLMKQLQNAGNKMSFINERIDEFLVQLQNQSPQIVPLSFAGLNHKWKSQLTQHFTVLQTHLGRLSEVIISQDLFHTHNFRKFERFIGIVELFSKVMSGDEAVAEEWSDLVTALHQQRQIEGFSDDECRLLRILDDCLSIERSRYSHIKQEQNDKTNRTNEALQVQVNKLIEDYEMLRQQNVQLANNLELQQRLKEELIIQVDQRDKIIKNLSAKKLNLERRAGNQENQSIISGVTRGEETKKLEHQVQKYLERSLLLAEQLKVSEGEREKLIQGLESQKGKYLRAYESASRLRPQKDQLDTECQNLRHQIETLKNQNQRGTNRHNKMTTDLNNEKTLLEMQLDTAQKNNLRLLERLDLNQKKLAQYSKIMMSRLDEKDDNNNIPRLERQNQRLKRQIQANQGEMKDFENQNKILRDDVATLKFKLKQSQLSRADSSEYDDAISEYRVKLEKALNKNQNLTRSLEESKTIEEQLEEKLRQLNKKVKTVEVRQKDLQKENGRLTYCVDESERKSQDMQRQLDQMKNWSERQIRMAREGAPNRELELMQKNSIIVSLEVRLKLFEQQLLQKTQQSQKASLQLAQTKMKQFESTIETHKLIELKLQEQNRSLKKDLDAKVQIQIKLTSQIDRLAKEIDRMKAQLDKYLRELMEKQLTIKLQRQKLEDQQKQLREFQVKEKMRKQGTPSHLKPSLPQTQTPSQFDSESHSHEPLSRSNMRYDNYYNAREYDRLSKEYNDFKKHTTAKIDLLETQLAEALKNNNHLKNQVDATGSGERSNNRQADWQQKIMTLQTTIKNLEKLNKEMKNGEEKIYQDMQNQKRGLIDHYESKINNLTGQKDKAGQQLNAEIERLRRQLHSTQSSSQIEREKQEKFNELKRSMESLLSQKNKLLQENYRILSQRNNLQQEKYSLSQQLISIKEKLQSQILTIQSLQARLKNGDQRKMQELIDQVNNLSKERDLIRNQYQSMRQHLQEQTKRAINIEAQLIKAQGDLSNERKDKIKLTESHGKDYENSGNVDYLNAKIRAMKEALSAVGDQLTDCKALTKQSKPTVPPGSNFAQSRVYSTAEPAQLQKHQAEWNKKETLYLQEIQIMSREIISLRDTIARNKSTQRTITTTLPQASIPYSSTYKDGNTLGNRGQGRLRVDKFLEAKKRFQKMQFSDSLSKWGVPSVVCQQIEDLRLSFLGMSQSILTINQEQIQLEQRLANSPSLSNLLEYAFRIVTFFSEIDANGPEAAHIKNQLDNIARQHTGGLFFTVLQEYTIHLLQNNTIQEYKRELRTKAQELLQIKQKLQEVITHQIEQEERMVNRAQPLSSRLREPGHYTSSSFSSLQNSSGQH